VRLRLIFAAKLAAVGTALIFQTLITTANSVTQRLGFSSQYLIEKIFLVRVFISLSVLSERLDDQNAPTMKKVLIVIILLQRRDQVQYSEFQSSWDTQTTDIEFFK
jgi:hypothetical protein